MDFKIKRILNEDEIAGLLITVTDQTLQILLEKQLRVAEEKSKRNYEMINILKIEPQLVKEFLKQVESEIQIINENVKKFEKTGNALTKIDNIYRLMHSIKGNSSLLGLDFISEKAHDFEQIITDCNQDADCFMSKRSDLFVLINHINETIHEIHGLIGIMKNFYEDYKQDRGKKGELLVNAIYGLVNKAKDDKNQTVKFNYRKFDADILPADKFLNIKDILIQLIRNTLAHNFS